MGDILKCHRCERWYPKTFIQPYWIDGELYDLDPECASFAVDGAYERIPFLPLLLKEFKKFKEKQDITFSDTTTARIVGKGGD